MAKRKAIVLNIQKTGAKSTLWHDDWTFDVDLPDDVDPILGAYQDEDTGDIIVLDWDHEKVGITITKITRERGSPESAITTPARFIPVSEILGMTDLTGQMRGLLGEVSDTWGDACCEPLYDYGYTLTKESKKLLNRIDTLLSGVPDGQA
tara:strand:+ start:549 stop:998 length:450 start_codon:yes stop_codon:yes gene_type:complete